MKIQTPRQRIKSFNRQIEYWRCYGYTRICQQDICTFCIHHNITKDLEGIEEADCLLSVPKYLSGDDVKSCRRFRAVKNWRYAIENLLTDALMDIIKYQCKTYTENQRKQSINLTHKQLLNEPDILKDKGKPPEWTWSGRHG